MPSLQGFSDNSFASREDVVRASKALITPLLPYFSPASARVRIPETIGTGFDETAAQLEGLARPLFVVGALLHAGEPTDGLLQPWIRSLKAGTDPNHPEYWGGFEAMDQRMVEAEMVSFGLLAAQPSGLWDQLEDETRANVKAWLLGLMGKQFRTNNWLWFRVMAIIALIKVCGLDNEDLRAQMSQDLELLDSMRLQDGWSSDGVWPDADEVQETEAATFEKTGKANHRFWARQADYYSGSFAIQFSQLLYVKSAADLDPTRAEVYRQQARDFGSQFCKYFDSAGAAIPFGRSLVYRFACAGFFAALAVAEVDNLPEPLSAPGAVKGYLLRHLRWWAERSDGIFRSDGTINLGWAYPNMFLTEAYNSPQSVYWALKSLIVVALVADKPFWTEPEKAYPEDGFGVSWLPAPRQLLCNHPLGNHHFMLNPSQYHTGPHRNSTAKYCKFAYSSAFTFSLAVGNIGLGQFVPDNALLLSRDGTETWATKRICTDSKLGKASVIGESAAEETITVVSAQWFPWADRQVSVTSTLVPPSNRWPDWHVRVHRITILGDGIRSLELAEGGFAINGHRRSDNRVIPTVSKDAFPLDAKLGEAEGVLQDDGRVAVFSVAGVSGISTDRPTHEKASTSVSAIMPDPNTNLAACRTLAPVVQHSLSDLTSKKEVVLATKVFAISSEANGRGQLSGKTPLQRWQDQPRVRIISASGGAYEQEGDHIQLVA